MSVNVDEFKKLFDEFLVDYDSFTDKGNKAAARRARKALLEMGKLTKVVRAEIQEARNG